MIVTREEDIVSDLMDWDQPRDELEHQMFVVAIGPEFPITYSNWTMF